MIVYLIRDDIDRHTSGCDCGDCNIHNRSWGVAIFDVTNFELVDHYIANYEDLDKLHDLDPLDRIYGPSEESALHNATLYAESKGWSVIQ